MSPRAGVLGWPVAHSRSPAIHNAGYAAAGLEDWRYQLLPVPPELFAETVRALPAAGFAGANVTIPHKEAALAVSDVASESAREIGAANTLTFADGRIEADNTDAPGFLAALDEPPGGREACVLGAGGSARAVVWALREAGATARVWNRTAARAQRLAAELGVKAVSEVRPGGLLVNCTAVGLNPGSDPFADLPLEPGLNGWQAVVDLAYGPEETALVRAAREAGLPTVGGLEVLVRQGALSFERWTGRAAPLEAMRTAAGP